MTFSETINLIGQLNANGASSSMPQNVVIEYSVFSLLTYNGLIILAYLVYQCKGSERIAFSVGLVTLGVVSQYVLLAYGATSTWKDLVMFEGSMQYLAPFFVLIIMVIVLNTAFGMFLISRFRRS